MKRRCKLTHLIIDGDSWAYKIALKANTQLGFSSERAEAAVDRCFDALLEKHKAEKLTLCMSDPGRRYFRHDILPSYKHHRTHGPPLEGRDEVREMLVIKYRAVIIPTLEADDVVGILATQTEDNNDTRIIVSEDKDLLTIPGFHYNPAGANTVFYICRKQAEYNHLLQTLTGDACDGFKGCPGVGLVKAKKMLDGSKDRWQAIVSAYKCKGLTEADALVQARVARILRSVDWNEEKKEVIPWTP